MSEVIPRRGSPTLKDELEWMGPSHTSSVDSKPNVTRCMGSHSLALSIMNFGAMTEQRSSWRRARIDLVFFTCTVLGIAWCYWQVPVFRTDTSLEWTWVHHALPHWCTWSWDDASQSMWQRTPVSCSIKQGFWIKQVGKGCLLLFCLGEMYKLRLWEVLQYAKLPINLSTSQPPLLTLLLLLNILRGKSWLWRPLIFCSVFELVHWAHTSLLYSLVTSLHCFEISYHSVLLWVY